MKNLKLLTLPKILMLIGAAWIIIFNLLYATNVISNYNFYGWKENGIGLVFTGITYILIPFSVKSGTWSKIWALLITALSIMIMIGLLVGSNVDYKAVLTYINILPHIIMAIGALLWIFISK